MIIRERDNYKLIFLTNQFFEKYLWDLLIINLYLNKN